MQNTTKSTSSYKLLVILCFAALYIIWGSTYIAILFAIKDIPPILMAGIRFLVAGGLLLIFFLLRGDSLPDRKSIGKISFGGSLMLFIGTGSVAWVEQYISSGLAAIIVATVPLWFVILDKRQWKFNFGNKWILLGLLIGFIGIVVLFIDKDTFDFAGDKNKVISFFVLLAGTIAWAAGSLYSKYTPVQGSTGMKASIQMLAAGCCAIITALLTGEQHDISWGTVSWQSWAGLIYLILFGSMVAFMAYVWLLKEKPPTIVGTYGYVNPIVAVLLARLFFPAEHIPFYQIIALLVILSGVVLVTLTKEKN